MAKSKQYALTGFIIGFILSFSGCKLWIGDTLHGESEMFGLFAGLLFGALFAIIGSIIGSSEEKKQNKNVDIVSKLEKLHKLKLDGIISDEEFNDQKKKIMN
ncbi:MAG: hypothetical protein RIQ61_830 [Bacteroidota bacterium]|jgi:hypothetical protein